jgi:hypothetical protein
MYIAKLSQIEKKKKKTQRPSVMPKGTKKQMVSHFNAQEELPPLVGSLLPFFGAVCSI